MPEHNGNCRIAHFTELEPRLLLSAGGPSVSGFVRNDGQNLPGEMNSLAFTFDQSVGASIDVNDLVLRNETTLQGVNLAGASVGYDSGTNTARWNLSALSLARGYYTLRLNASGVQNSSTQPLDGNGDGLAGDDYVVRNVLLAASGDANLDAAVDVIDLGLLATNYGLSGQSWQTGDFNGDHTVDVIDLGNLATNYGTTLGYTVPPTAVGDAASTDKNTPVTISVLGNDSAGGAASIGLQNVTQPQHGTAQINGTSVLYTPTAGYYGSDVFVYTIVDNLGRTDNATVAVTVNQVNAAPSAVNDSGVLLQDTTLTVNVLANDSDPDNDPLNISSFGQGAHGNVTSVTGGLKYTPAAGWYGSDSFSYTISDGQGGTASATVSLTVQIWSQGTYTVTSASFLGGTSASDAVRGSAVLSDGTIVLAANISDAIPGGLTPILLNGATSSSAGAILRLSSDGQTVISVSRVASQVIDLSVDGSDNLYVAAWTNGLLKLNSSATAVIYAKTYSGSNVWRVDAGPTGYCAVSLHGNTLTDPDASDPGPGTLYAYDPSGTQLGSFAGYRNTLDVCIDEATQTVINVGWRQASVSGVPVQISFLRGQAFDGTIKWTDYDWSTDSANPGFINRPENNMADTRGYRVTMGKDGKCYAAYECAGGNHIFRYQPWLTDGNWVSAAGLIVGGDQYHQFYNSKSEHKSFVGRYDPATGTYLLGQQFTARLTTTGACNALRVHYGDMYIDPTGRLYLTCTSGSGGGNGNTTLGLPYTYNPSVLSTSYGGGPTLIVMSPNFASRLFVGRVTGSGDMRTVAVGYGAGGEYIVTGGSTGTTSAFAALNPIQSSAGGGTNDGFIMVMKLQPSGVGGIDETPAGAISDAGNPPAASQEGDALGAAPAEVLPDGVVLFSAQTAEVPPGMETSLDGKYFPATAIIPTSETGNDAVDLFNLFPALI